jgi:hypothetical protein
MHEADAEALSGIQQIAMFSDARTADLRVGLFASLIVGENSGWHDRREYSNHSVWSQAKDAGCAPECRQHVAGRAYGDLARPTVPQR